MVSTLADWLVELCHDRQRDHNQIEEEERSSPQMMLLMMAFSSALNQLLDFPNCPIRSLIPELGSFADNFGPLLVEATSNLIETPLSVNWSVGHGTPRPIDVDHAMQRMHEECLAAKRTLVNWRLELLADQSIRFDRRLNTFIFLADMADEVYFYDTHPLLSQLAHWSREVQVEYQGIIRERNIRARHEQDRAFSRSRPY